MADPGSKAGRGRLLGEIGKMRQFQVGMGVDQTRHEHGVGMVKDFRTRITAGDFPEPADPNNFSCLHC
jgi:hypothetical protein